MVSRGIAGRVAFRFHDSATEPALRQIVHHDLPNQKARQFQRVTGKLFSTQPSNFERRVFHGLQRAYVRRLVVKEPREFRMVDHDGGVQLNSVKIFLLEGVA